MSHHYQRHDLASASTGDETSRIFKATINLANAILENFETDAHDKAALTLARLLAARRSRPTSADMAAQHAPNGAFPFPPNARF
jgi:hypothetical protein